MGKVIGIPRFAGRSDRRHVLVTSRFSRTIPVSPLRGIADRLLCRLVLAGCVLLPALATGAELTPFQTFNQSPLVQIFGLPAAGPATVAPAGSLVVSLVQDVANNFAEDGNAREQIHLDGESYRTTLALRYGLAKRVEIGLELPLVGNGGGVFDNFIEGWHDFFGLPDGGRTQVPRNRLVYSYAKDGRTRLLLNDSGYGLGDLRLTGGWQLYRHDGDGSDQAVALRGSLKFPTGNSNQLQGSGSTDLALWLSGSSTYRLPPAWGDFGLFAAAGAMVMSRGDVLGDQQEPLVGFGTLGFGWSPLSWLALKVQLAGHTPFYGDSDLRELSHSALQGVFGGTIAFSPTTTLDIGVAEDLAVNTTPDVTLNVALSRRF
ncbi:MAG TPA: DUF3187 family protein [Geobacteraceae bacterium]